MKSHKYISAVLLIVSVLFLNILIGFNNWNIDLTSDKKHVPSKGILSYVIGSTIY